MPATTQQLALGPWTGGVIYAVPPEDVPPEGLAGMENAEVGLGGYVTTRPGYAKYISSALAGTPTLTGVGEQVFSSASSAVFCIAGTKFYEDVSGTWTDRTGGVTITAGDDNTWSWVNANGALYATQNAKGNAPIKWAAAGGNIAAADVDSRFTQAAWCEWWDNRLWYGNENNNAERVWYSDLLAPETINATAFLNMGGAITGLKGLRTMLTVHREDAIHTVYYDSGLAAYIQEQRADRGTVAGRSVVVNAQGQMFFIRRDGIYQWDIDSPVATDASGMPRKISVALDGSRYWDSINADRLAYSWAVDNQKKNCIWFALPYGANQTDMNHIMVYDYARQIWYGPYLDFTRNCGAYFSDKPQLGGYDDGLLYTHESGTSDNSTAIDAWFETAAQYAVAPGVDVRWLWATTAFGVTGNYNITVQQASSRIVTRTEQFNAGGGFDAIGSFVIGTSSIAGATVLRSADTPLQGYDDAIQLKYSNANADESFNIRRTTVPYRPIGIIPHTSSGVS